MGLGRTSLILATAACALLGGFAANRFGSPGKADLADLARARVADSPAAWEDYRARHPQGIARAEADAALGRLAARQPVEVPAAEDQALITRLEGRLAQLKESVARRESPAVAEPPSPTVPPQSPPSAEDPRMMEPAEQLADGCGIDLDPQDPEQVRRWTRDGAMHSSSDAGRTWRAERPADAGWRLDRRALRPLVAPRTVFIAARSGTAHLGLLSRDGGASWNPLPAPWADASPVEARMPQPAILTAGGMLVAPARVGTAAVLWTSGDLGATWRQEPPQEGFHTLAPVGDGCLALFRAADDQLMRSTDLGRTRGILHDAQKMRTAPAAWDAIGDGLALWDPATWCAMWRIDRRGAATGTWMPAYPDMWDIQNRPQLAAFAVDPRDPKHWFAASPALGLLRSEDAGQRWKACRIDRRVGAIAIRRAGVRTLLAATGRSTLVLDLTAPVSDLFTVEPVKLAERLP